MSTSRLAVSIAILALLLAVGRIVSSYAMTAETFDEPCHVAAAIELLDRGTYQLDPYNTPLARLAIGMPLYLTGSRLPHYAPDDPASRNYIDVGNKILNDKRGMQHNLKLARYGVLPFFVLASLLVFCWCKREFGNLAAVMSIMLFTTLPPILALSSVAYTDISTVFAQPAALLAFTLWLDQPNLRRALGLGFTTGLAMLAKFTTLVYLPFGAASILAVKWLWPDAARKEHSEITRSAIITQIAAASLVVIVVVWGGYRFSTGHVQESMGLSPSAMPTFQHFPARLQTVAKNLVLDNPRVPAPGLFHGIALVYSFNKNAPPSYFMGQIRRGGWWYFSFVDIALKTPPAFLILSLVGGVALCLDRKRKWTNLSCATPIVGILLATILTNVHYGVRHVIVVYAFMAIVSGYGAAYLWRLKERRFASRALLVGLLAWQIGSSVSANSDFLSYFNVFAGRDPSKILVSGCDLDCGQDLIRLSYELKERKVSHVTLALWTVADMSQVDIPPFDVAQANKPVTGWVAISLRALREGDVFHASYPIGSFDWLGKYQPVKRVGRTILLYNIPEQATLTGP